MIPEANSPELAADWSAYRRRVRNFVPVDSSGKVTELVGLVIETEGPAASLGDLCTIQSQGQSQGGGEPTLAEVVGFKRQHLLLMPLGRVGQIGPGSLVQNTHRRLSVPVGANLLGRVIDPLGRPIDGLGPFVAEERREVYNTPPEAMLRPRIQAPLSLGVRALDGMLTIGAGQRIGIFAGSGVGKSTLLGSIARNATADVNVIGLIGERGREVREFVERDLGPEGLARSVVVVATSDQPAVIRARGAQTTTAIAEYFRDQGKQVMLMMDSVTRFASAQREIGLAIGEPPTTRGYTPSVFATLPQLLERAGTSEKGSITGLYTVLVDGDDMNEPVADAVRGILDGHVVLSRDLAQKGHYPAIDVLKSVSRLMSEVADKDHRQAAQDVRQLLAAYRNAEDLIQLGAYAPGSNATTDRAILHRDAINQFLTQRPDEPATWEAMRSALLALGK